MLFNAVRWCRALAASVNDYLKVPIGGGETVLLSKFFANLYNK